MALSKSIQKSILWGAIFGALIIPISTLGLAILFIEVIFRPLTLVPRLVVINLVDTSTMPGIISILLLMLVSAFCYALIFSAFVWLKQKTNTVVMVGVLLLLTGIVFAVTVWGTVQKNSNDSKATTVKPSNDTPVEKCEGVPDPTDRCKGYFQRYYFNQTVGRCVEFIYGGCGNFEGFDDYDQCQTICEQKIN